MRIDQTPYEELDPPVVNLCRAVNALPGVWTIGSCSGHEEGTGVPTNQWYVGFEIEIGDDHRPTAEAWLSFELLAWNVWAIRRADALIDLTAFAPPPYEDECTHWPRFSINGDRGPVAPIEADEVASLIAQWASEYLVAN